MNSRLLLPLAVPVAAVLLSCTSVSAQDAATEPGDATPVGTLIDALGTAAKTGVTLAGKVTDKTEGDGETGMGMMIIGGMGGKPGKKFEGKFEATTRGRTAFVCSQKKLPGVAVMTNGNTTLVRRTEAVGEAVDTKALSEDVIRFLNLSRIAKEVTRADKKASESKRKKYAIKVETSDDGTHTIEVPLRTSTLPAPDAGRMNLMQAKVLEIRGTFVVSPQGTLQSMSFSVTRSDPMAALRKRAMEGGGRLEISDPSDLEDDDPEEGAKAEYAFRVVTTKMSARAKALISDLESLFEL